jgi:quercetin dioxygenase-like cupin family protein
MQQRSKRLRQAPEQRFAGVEHVYDLTAMAERLRSDGSAIRDGHRQITLDRQGSVSFVLFDFVADGRLTEHAADAIVSINVIAGQVDVQTDEGDHRLEAGMLLVLSPNVQHDLHAIKASQVLLTVHLIQD